MTSATKSALVPTAGRKARRLKEKQKKKEQQIEQTQATFCKLLPKVEKPARTTEPDPWKVVIRKGKTPSYPKKAEKITSSCSWLDFGPESPESYWSLSPLLPRPGWARKVRIVRSRKKAEEFQTLATTHETKEQNFLICAYAVSHMRRSLWSIFFPLDFKEGNRCDSGAAFL